MESLFFAKNVRSAMTVAEAIGVIKVAAKNLGKPIFEYTPLQIKMALVGYGRAEKEQVELMVRDCLGLEEPITPGHASDAVAAALTHEFTMRL
ncbi:MAG: Crossover junction endodeoxyribonuclease RuvC [Candidatus Shapirobacteria bacterium GW2011_GWF1_38_23]|nr:MAG: Crossover junction endodeoxyribonuclease RuvC [Candidatus Shapirobacteria bacterium GW2011_GWF1_38_23]